MTKPANETLRKKRELQRLAEEQTERERAELLQQQAEEEARKLHALQQPEDETPTPVQVGVKPLTPFATDWPKIIEAYTKQFNKAPEQDNCLIFPDKASMEKFFTEQAAAGQRFFCVLVGADGKPTNHFEFSCGNGKRYSGSAEQIREELTQALETAGPDKDKVQAGLDMLNKYIQDAKPNPAQSAREALKNLTQREEERPGYKSSSPLPTTNKPTGF